MSANSVGGDLGVFSIFDVTQSLMVGRKTARVTIVSQGRKGFLSFRNGQIVAAMDDRLVRGEQAATTIFAWRGGTFSISFDVPPEQDDITVPTDYLLLDVARNLDEVRHETGVPAVEASAEEAAAVEDEVQDRLQHKLRTELNSAFRQVATAMEPARALYRSDAFDQHLGRLMELKGTALFLEVGRKPRVRTPSAFEEIDSHPVGRDEMDLYVAAILNEREQADLDERREVITCLHAERLGTFRVHVMRDAAGFSIGFTPLQREVADLELLCSDPRLLSSLQRTTRGLVVVGGPLGSGKPGFVAALARWHMQDREAFAMLYSTGYVHDMGEGHGYCIQRETPPPGAAFHAAMRAALNQLPDVLGIAGTSERDALRDAFHVALGASGGERLVVYALDSQSPPDTVTRLLRLARTADGDPLRDALAENLRLVVDLRPAASAHPGAFSHLEVDDRVRELIRTGDLAALKRHLITRAQA